MAKDLFSGHADTYAKYRPSYPLALFDYICSFVHNKDRAWDCATGNGQAAVALSDYFSHIDATDISQKQIDNAIPRKNISYHCCPAEATPFESNSFDLITVAQAYHWLDWNKFAKEAERVAKRDAVVAVWGYHLVHLDDEKINNLILHFYRDITGPFWDAERKYVDEYYRTVDFPYELLPVKQFTTELEWEKSHLLGYLESWSAVQHYTKQKGHAAIDLIRPELDRLWDDNKSRIIRFPVFMRIGRVKTDKT